MIRPGVMARSSSREAVSCALVSSASRSSCSVDVMLVTRFMRCDLGVALQLVDGLFGHEIFRFQAACPGDEKRNADDQRHAANNERGPIDRKTGAHYSRDNRFQQDHQGR